MMFSQKSGHFVAVWLTRAPDRHGGVQVHGGQGHSRTRGSVPTPLRGRFPRRVGPLVAAGVVALLRPVAPSEPAWGPAGWGTMCGLHCQGSRTTRRGREGAPSHSGGRVMCSIWKTQTYWLPKPLGRTLPRAPPPLGSPRPSPLLTGGPALWRSGLQVLMLMSDSCAGSGILVLGSRSGQWAMTGSLPFA